MLPSYMYSPQKKCNYQLFQADVGRDCETCVIFIELIGKIKVEIVDVEGKTPYQNIISSSSQQ